MKSEELIFHEKFVNVCKENDIKFSTYRDDNGVNLYFVHHLMTPIVRNLMGDSYNTEKHLRVSFGLDKYRKPIELENYTLDKAVLYEEDVVKLNKHIVDFILKKYKDDTAIEIDIRIIEGLKVLFISDTRWVEVRVVIECILDFYDIHDSHLVDEFCHSLVRINSYQPDCFTIPLKLVDELKELKNGKEICTNLSEFLKEKLGQIILIDDDDIGAVFAVGSALAVEVCKHYDVDLEILEKEITKLMM